MQTEIIKSNLREYYNKDAPLRNSKEKAEWKISQRSDFWVVSRILRTFQRDLIYTRFSLLLAPPVLKLIDSYSYIA